MDKYEIWGRKEWGKGERKKIAYNIPKSFSGTIGAGKARFQRRFHHARTKDRGQPRIYPPTGTWYGCVVFGFAGSGTRRT
jgi:hypothetical protein